MEGEAIGQHTEDVLEAAEAAIEQVGAITMGDHTRRDNPGAERLRRGH